MADERHVCPVWVGYLLASPIRKLFENPGKILSPFVGEGMTVVDIGSAMGFFSIPMAKMVGSNGTVICVDIQEKMLEKLMKRAAKASVDGIIETRLSGSGSLGIADFADTVDFALASAVVHEVPVQEDLFADIYVALKKGGKCLVAEPKGHVDKAAFDKTVSSAEGTGFTVIERRNGRRTFEVVLEK